MFFLTKILQNPWYLAMIVYSNKCSSLYTSGKGNVWPPKVYKGPYGDTRNNWVDIGHRNIR